MSKETEQLQRIIEGALMAAGKPLKVNDLLALFDEDEQPAREDVRTALEDIQHDCRGRGFELKEVASGFRFQVVQDVAPWVSRLWDEKPQKYSRALLETLSLIAYRQPITRGDIEDIRGVAVSSHIIKTLTEREWVRVVGHKDVPGRPSLYATTRQFLDYFNLKNLDELPTLAEIRDLESMNEELALEGADTPDPEAVAAGLVDEEAEAPEAGGAEGLNEQDGEQLVQASLIAEEAAADTTAEESPADSDTESDLTA